MLRYVVAAVLFILVLISDGSDSYEPSRDRSRFRQRLWLTRARIRREQEKDPAAVEQRLQQWLAGFSTTPPVAWIQHGSMPPEAVVISNRPADVWVDASHYRQIGAGRAAQIAGALGWFPAPGAEKHLPRWLHLRFAVQEGISS
jgi:hypothetical protein